MKTKHQIIVFASSLCCAIFSNLPAHAENRKICPDYPPIPASQNSKVVQLKKLIEFKIPANFRTIPYRNKTEASTGIYNPSSFRTIDCMVKNNIGTEDFYVLATIRVKVLDRKEDLIAINRKLHARGGIWNIENLTINGQAAIKYRHSILSGEHVGFSFLKPDGKTLVNISYAPSPKSSIVNTEKLAAQIVDSIR